MTVKAYNNIYVPVKKHKALQKANSVFTEYEKSFYGEMKDAHNCITDFNNGLRPEKHNISIELLGYSGAALLQVRQGEDIICRVPYGNVEFGQSQGLSLWGDVSMRHNMRIEERFPYLPTDTHSVQDVGAWGNPPAAHTAQNSLLCEALHARSTV